MSSEWREFTCYRLTSVPRQDDDDKRADPVRSQLFAALTAAHAALLPADGGGRPAVVVGLVRPPGREQLSFLVGGRPGFPPAAGESASATVPVMFPPGALGVRLPADEPGAIVGSLPHWISCTGRADALWMPDNRASTGRVRGSFDDYAAHLSSPFAWLVVAVPLAASVLQEELDGLEVRVPRLRQRVSSEGDRVELERAEARYRELSRARSSGLWSVRVLVGGETAEDARAAAGLLCTASELDDLPYALVPGAELRRMPAPDDLGDGAFTATTDLLAALTRPPGRELPGIRIVSPHRFDVTPEDVGDGPAGFPLGDVLDRAHRCAGVLAVPRGTLNRHAFVCGATGSGKSQTMRALLEALACAADPVPWLVIEPAKAEYARMAGRLGNRADVTVIRPGDLDVAPAALNPLEPEPGFPLQSHADLVRALFLAAFQADEPFPQVLSHALTQVYTDAGWDLVTGEPRPATRPKLRRCDPDEPRTPRYPNLGELQATARRVVENIGYGKEVTADVRGFIDVRMGSLRQGTPGRFFEGGHPVDVAALLGRNVVLELEGISSDQDKAFLIGAVLIRIVEHLRVRLGGGGSPALRHVTVVEEAHRLLRNVQEGPAAAAVELFASLLAEVRAYGEGVVVVEQIPAKILPDVLKNSALKIMHRLPAEDDRAVVGATMNLTPEQSEYVVSLPPGTAAVALDGMDRPVLVRVPVGEDREGRAGALALPPLTGSRSAGCTAVCGAAPCTLRRINDAHHLAREPLVVVWVEAVVVAHLIGRPPPQPSARCHAVLAGADPVQRGCVLAHTVEAAVDARRTLLRTWMDAEEFTEQVLRTLHRPVGEPDPGEGDWLRWTAGMYRWQEIRMALRRCADGAGRHPDSALWAELGMTLDGATAADQLAALQRDPAYAPGAEQVLVGDATRLRGAVRALTGNGGRTGLAAALRMACGGGSVAAVEGQIAHLMGPDGRSA